MLECILGSIAEVCFHKIVNEDVKYTLQGSKSTALIYKLLIYKAIVDSRSTTSHFRMTSTLSSVT